MTNVKPKIMLLNPPSDVFAHKLSRTSFPLGICYLGTFLKNKGFHVCITDTQIGGADRVKLGRRGVVRVGLRMEKIEDRIKDFAPDVLGISCNFHTNFYPTMDIAKIAKSKCNIRYVVVGGSYASVVPERIMQVPFIDYLVIGEGEETLATLLQKLFHNPSIEFGQLDGLAYRRGSGEMQINKKTKFIAPEEFITPDRDLLPVEKYIRPDSPHNMLTKGRRVLEVSTSRGCNAACTFCASRVVWGGFRGRRPEAVIEELKLLKSKYDIDEVQFLDDNLTLDKKRAERLFQLMIEEKLNLHWCTPNGVAIATLDDNLIKLMKESGCYMVILPIESGSQYVLTKLIRKPLVLDRLYPLVRTFRRYKISTEAFLVIGTPGETFQDIKKTFDFVFKLGIIKAHFNYAMPIPSTQLYIEYQRFKKNKSRQSEGDDIYEECYFDYRVPAISTDEWTSLELKKFVSGMVINFYMKNMIFRPHLFIKEMGKIFFRPRLFFELVRYSAAYISKDKILNYD